MDTKEKAKEKEECTKAKEKDSRAKECSKEKERERLGKKDKDVSYGPEPLEGMQGKGRMEL